MSDSPVRKILVTGGSGFLGRRLVDRLTGGPYTLLAPRSNDLDIADRKGVEDFLQRERPDLVYHLAGSNLGRKGGEDLLKVAEVNTMGTVYLLAASLKSGVRRLVVTGTGDEHGGTMGSGPRSAYAASKAAATAFLQAAKNFSELQTVVLRLFAVYGEGQSPDFFIPQLIEAARAGRTLNMTDGLQKRDFIWLDDVVGVLVEAGFKDEVNEGVYDVCTGSAVTLREVVSLVAELSGRQALASYGTLPQRKSEPFHIDGDPEPLRKEFGEVLQTRLRQGLAKLLECDADVAEERLHS